MGKLVFLDNNRLVTDSLMVAEKFGKTHDKVLRDIRELECSKEFSLANFGESTYINERGREYPRYLITFDGFMFLVMGYTGPDAAKYKEEYINEFNRMKDELKQPQIALPQNYVEALKALVTAEEEKLTLQNKIELDKPLVHFAQSLQISQDAILVADMAKLLKQNGIDTGEQRLYRWLRENGYLIKSGSEYNMPTQRSMEMKLFEVKVTTRQGSDGTPRQQRTSKITGKGQIYFLNKFKPAA